MSQHLTAKSPDGSLAADLALGGSDAANAGSTQSAQFAEPVITAQKRTLTASASVADNARTYTVQVGFGDDAEVPEGARLVVAALDESAADYATARGAAGEPKSTHSTYTSRTPRAPPSSRGQTCPWSSSRAAFPILPKHHPSECCT